MEHIDKTIQADRFHRSAIKVKDAQDRIRPFLHIRQKTIVSLQNSLGRVLAEDIYATEPMPHFRRSGVDGFAIRAQDTLKSGPVDPVLLDVVEDIPCGSIPEMGIGEGQAARIMTGAMIPEGADSIIMLEMCEERTESGGRKVLIKKAMHPGENMAHIGAEVEAGELLMAKGELIRATEMSVLAAFGYSQIPVFQQPRVAVFATGSELLDVNEPLQPGKIRNSNAYLMSAMVREAGGETVLLGQIPDDVQKARRTIMEAFEEADMVITSGGVSVGDYDILVDVLASWSGQLLFNKLAMRPGSPTTAGVYQEKLLFALSGNPGACYVGFELLVRPALKMLQGVADPYPKMLEAYLAEDFTKGIAVERYVRGTLHYAKGEVWAKPLPRDKSSMMVSSMQTEVLIIIPPGGRGVKAGELVKVLCVN